ncbi:MAG: hypothetical protein NVS9B15_17080 [Acidobacteriaceae bacterium]
MLTTILMAGLLAGSAVPGQTSSANSASANEAAGASSQNGAKAQANGSVQEESAASPLSAGTVIDATLTKTLDAKKAKEGDAVSAKTNQDVRQGGKIVIARGSKLTGHVTEAEAKTKENSGSKLGIVFDRAVSKGQEVPLHAVLRAVIAPIQIAASDDSGVPPAGPSGGPAVPAIQRGNGGLLGGTKNGSINPVRDAADGDGGSGGRTGGPLGGLGVAAGQNVSGLPGITLGPIGSNGGGGTLSSTTRNVHLDSGTRLILAATGSAASPKP